MLPDKVTAHRRHTHRRSDLRGARLCRGGSKRRLLWVGVTRRLCRAEDDAVIRAEGVERIGRRREGRPGDGRSGRCRIEHTPRRGMKMNATGHDDNSVFFCGRTDWPVSRHVKYALLAWGIMRLPVNALFAIAE